MITFVCCYNDESVLDQLLKPSLDRLLHECRVEFRTLLIDTRHKSYSSAAQAFNTEVETLPKVKDDILVFLHQDIAFNDSKAWLRLIDEFSKDPNQIIGFAGMSKFIGRTISNLKDKGNNQYLTLTRVDDKTEVESLDECCFAITREWFDKIKFDEIICDHWHLYAVNLCYQARNEYGIKSYVLPETLYHKMTTDKEMVGGSLYADTNFLRALRKMAKKYRSIEQTIYTPCYICPTSHIGMNIKILKTMLRNHFRK